jgi:hypothetical protein
MPNEGEVYFGLFGDDFDPESLSIGIGIRPRLIPTIDGRT